MSSSPFHDGERAAQRWAGAPLSSGSFIRPFLPNQHREFFEQLPFVLVGSMSDNVQPTASLLAGPPGFVRTQPDTLEVFTEIASHDALGTNLRRGARLGLLGIEPHTRRRNRVNGVVLDVKRESFTLLVEQSFGNCPKYITQRKLVYEPTPVSAVRRCALLTDRERALMARADTFFIASAHPLALGSNDPCQSVDVSHRGGPPGFVEFTSEDTFTIADYPGNNLFNTFGNIVENPKVGLLFWDFANGALLQLTANAQLMHGSSAQGSNTERRVTFRVSAGQYIEGGCPRLC